MQSKIGKIIKIFVTRCQILKLNCSNSILARALSQAALGSLQCSPYSQADIRGLFFIAGRGREEKGDRNGREREEAGRDSAVQKIS